MSDAWGGAWGVDVVNNNQGACNSGVCGTGGWSGPLPGDPSNNAVLSAVAAYGGVELSWTLPTTNYYAVSLVNIFRGTTNNPAFAIRKAAISGDFYFDKIAVEDIREYFYWIQIVSTNGTEGALIGPVAAIPMNQISEIIDQLTGKIESGILSETLRGELSRIPLLDAAIQDEAVARLADGSALSDALSAVQSQSDQALTFIQNEITQRTNADSALLSSVNTLAAGLGNTAALVSTESLARAAADNSLAAQITTTESTLNTNIATASTTLNTAISTVDGKVTNIGALYTAKLKVNGLVGGFGVYNDGSTIEAGFDVDNFWIGHTSPGKVKPFVVSGDTVYLSNTVVPTIQSNNYNPGVSGWIIRKEGPAEFQDVTIRGHVEATSGSFTGELQGATGSFTGDVNALSGYFSGVVATSSVQAALSSSTNYTFTTAGAFSQLIPNGLDADSIRVFMIGGSGGGGGGGGGSTQYPGGSGGTGASGGSVEFTLSYATYKGTTLSGTVGQKGNGGTYGIGYGGGGAAGSAGSSGGATSVTGIGSTAGGLGGGGGGGGTLDSVIPAVPGHGGANGVSYSGGGAGGAAGDVYINGVSGNGVSGISGTVGYVLISIYKGNVLVKNTSYQALLTWLNGRGIGTVPVGAY